MIKDSVYDEDEFFDTNDDLSKIKPISAAAAGNKEMAYLVK